MTTTSEPLFGGMPAIPAPEVFERARRSNPAWVQALEQGYAQFAARPEAQGIFPDPKGGGATIQQIWMFFTLFGMRMYCALARPLADARTSRIERLVNSTPKEVVQWLQSLQLTTGALGVVTAYHDGATGHCIRLVRHDVVRDRFVYHDPWPERSLLAKENNPAGIDAQPEEGRRWSVTSAELERVIYAAFFFPIQWARLHAEPVDHPFENWTESEFFKFFRLRKLAEQSADGLVHRVFAPGAFQQQIALVVSVDPGNDLIRKASLRLRRDWLVTNLPLALDLAKSFVLCFAPEPDRPRYEPVARTLYGMTNQAELVRIRDANPDESEPVRLAQAFMGRGEADMVSDFAQLKAGSATPDGHAVQYLEVTLD